MFKPSKELWQILIDNGFKNVSHHYKEEHLNFGIKRKDEYDARFNRMAFAMIKNKSKFIIFFDYEDIEIVFGGKNMAIDRANLTENQLRSIITFFKMSYKRRYSIVEMTNTRIENSWEIFEKNKKHYGYEFPFEREFEKIFHECKIEVGNPA